MNELRIDPGSQVTGFALVTPKNEIIWGMDSAIFENKTNFLKLRLFYLLWSSGLTY